MISCKTVVTLSFIILSMKTLASTSPNNTQILGNSALQTRRRKVVPTSKAKRTTHPLNDLTNTVEDVTVKGNIETDHPQEVMVPPVNEFEELITQGKYAELIKLGEGMNGEEFLRRLFPVVKTLKQYREIAGFLENHHLVESFYVYGNMQVVREVIMTESWIYDKQPYAYGGLEFALSLALQNDRHDRAIELLDIRKEITAERDNLDKQLGHGTSFGNFVSYFFFNNVPWKSGMIFKRFFTLRGDELRSKHPEIIDTLWGHLAYHFRCQPDEPNVKNMLIDLIGQPSLLSSASFVKGFLHFAKDKDRSDLIKYGWREAIREGLKSNYKDGGEKLWRVMTEEHPKCFSGAYPSTNIALTAVLAHFPTKRELEKRWGKKNVPDFRGRLEKIIANGILPTVSVGIIIDYTDLEPTWLDIEARRPPDSTWEIMKRIVKEMFG